MGPSQGSTVTCLLASIGNWKRSNGFPMAFQENVFINCPFDDDYLPLLRPLLFTVIYLGLTPKIALDNLDSGEPRIKKIIALIEESKFAIHDLSRLRSRCAGEYSRLNMPFELGIDVACRLFKRGRSSTKKCLILETERFRYQRALSDLSNSDIMSHNNEPQDVVAVIRSWLVNAAGLRSVGAAAIWYSFNDFLASNYEDLKSRGFSEIDIERLPARELIDCMKEWIRICNLTTYLTAGFVLFVIASIVITALVLFSKQGRRPLKDGLRASGLV